MAEYSKYNIVYRLQKWMDSVPGQTFLNYAYSWVWGYGGATGSSQAGQSLFCLPEIKEKRAGNPGISEVSDYSGFQCLSRLNPRP